MAPKRLSIWIGILLFIMGLTTGPAGAATPTLKNVMEAILAIQNSVNNLESFQENMTPPWYQTLPSDQRFILVMHDKAILDRETGLIWEKSPVGGTRSWNFARKDCMNSALGGRMGWRLPTIEELASLVDPNKPDGVTPYLPAGHPFDNVQRSWYWSATSHDRFILNFRVVDFRNGTVTAADYADAGGSSWCVRGGQGNPLLFWGNFSLFHPY